MSDFRTEVIRQIEAGAAPWQKPWQPGVIRTAPFNPASGRDYRGINAWWLDLQGRGDPRWLTYKQAAALDAQVRKGERGTTVQYWQWTRDEPRRDAAGQPVLSEDGKPETVRVRLDKPHVFTARVFNAEQIDGLAPLVVPAPAFAPVEAAERTLAAAGVAIHHDQGDRAFYRPATDAIHLPPPAAFAAAYEYYATALHEVGHATGHHSRLDRPGGPFGSRDYAIEELRAEMASFMLTTELGLGHYPERHAGYVESWLKALQDDHGLLFRAARDADVIRQWVLAPEKRPELERMARDAQGKASEKVHPVVTPAPERPQSQEAAMPDRAPRPDEIAGMAWWNGLTEAGRAYELGRLAPGSSVADAWGEHLRRTQDPELAAERPVPPPRTTADYQVMIDSALPALHPFADEALARLTAEFADLPYMRADRQEIAAGWAEIALPAEAAEKLLADAAIASDWPARIADLLDLDGPADFRALALNLAEARYDPKAIERTAPLVDQVVARSPRHVELLSTLWDHLGPDLRWRFDEYIPAARRQDPLIAGLATDPYGATLTALGGQRAAAPPASQSQETAMPRIYLAVPYAEKEAAKALGARWDRTAKSWYAPEGVDPGPLARWQAPAQTQTPAAVPGLSPEAEFGEALKAHGLALPGAPVMDGRWHRAALAADRKGEMNGSYRGFLDGHPAGQITNYKTGQTVQWVATGQALTPEARAALAAEAATRAAQRAAERAERAERAAHVARSLLRGARLVDTVGDHPYLDRKNTFPASPVKVTEDGTLLIPMHNAAGVVRNVQQITAEGEKRYVAGAEKQGLYHLIDPDRMAGLGRPILIAEGYATANSLHEATGLPVAVAFDAGNLQPVAEALRAKYPRADLVIAADDDHGLPAKGLPNTGLEKAAAAAAAVGGSVLRPPFTEAERAQGLTDWNDLFLARGQQGMAAAINQAEALLALDPAPAPRTAPPDKAPPARATRQDRASGMAAGMTM